MSDGRTVWAVVPVKRFDLAKGRLADALTDDERRQLARAMLEDVLGALASNPEVDRVLVVTREPEVAALAASAGAATIAETGQGLNAAVMTGAEAAIAGEADVLLVVHGDLPLARSRDFSELLAIHGAAPALTIAPDHARDGSNCLAASPPDLIPFRFGAASFEAHCAEARARGIETRVLICAELATDVDRIEDLDAVCGANSHGRAVAF
ncbi:MAG: 2-phospho-L-lactate guanylyltransferase, partial [Pseudomonadales bacterium]|nr:2-phospho-L-lactate guanylyltransferase [Pseudomonadales bacterium]